MGVYAHRHTPAETRAITPHPIPVEFTLDQGHQSFT